MSIQRMYFPFQTMKANPGSNGRISNQSTSCMDKKKREKKTLNYIIITKQLGKLDLGREGVFAAEVLGSDG